MKLRNTKALVVGMERSGRAAAAFLREQGAVVTTTDLKQHDEAGFRVQNDELLAENRDLIVLSPGVPPDLAGLEKARARGVDVMGETELAAPFLLGRTIGITGSNGKTTTTSMLAHILRVNGVAAQVGGNIGTPVISMAATSRANQWNVLELSSFQLETTRTFHAHVAVCLNVTQNHLDRHHTFENYVAAKGNLFRTQQEGDHAVLNRDDRTCRDTIAELTPVPPEWFSAADIFGGDIYLDRAKLMAVKDLPVPGVHNALNAMAAAYVARIAGVSLMGSRDALKTFQAVEHRLEFVAETDGVGYYNDSKATSVDATIKALDSFDGNLWVILGGKDKGSDYTLLRERLMRKAHAVLLIGDAAEKIAGELDGSVEIIRAGTLARAVGEARQNAQPGDTVLLAPACASFDQFQSYEHRGQVFKDLVHQLSKDNGAKT